MRGAQLAFAGFLFWLVVVACSGSESEPPVAQVRSALTTSLIATKDSEVDEGHPHPSYGAATSMGVHGKTVRAIVAFDAQAVSRLSSSDARSSSPSSGQRAATGPHKVAQSESSR